MIKVPALPKCSKGGEHSLIRLIKINQTFRWECTLCNTEFTVYRALHLPQMVYAKEHLGNGHYVDQRIKA